MPSPGQGLADVCGDLGSTRVVGREIPVDRGDPAGSGWVGVAGVAEPGGVYAEDRRWAGVCAGWWQVKLRRAIAIWRRGVAGGIGDGVPDGADLQSDQVIKLVAPVGGGGQAEPAAGGDLLDRVLERCRRDVVAFVGDDQAIPGGVNRPGFVGGYDALASGMIIV